MKIAILGAGAGGVAAAVQLKKAGHDVRLWNRSSSALEDIRAARGITHNGVFGAGFVSLDIVTTRLATATDGADLLLVCLPTLAHPALAAALIESKIVSIPTVLNPGHTGGALEFSHVFRSRGLKSPPLAEFSTLTYVARKPSSDRVAITGVAKRVGVAAMPGGHEALQLACALFPCAQPLANVLVTSLKNVNMVLHPPGAILGAAWIEATGGSFTFYVEGLTEGVARIMGALDDERRAVGMSFGFDLPSLFDEMQAIGTIEESCLSAAGLATAIRNGEANRHIKAPEAFTHRYYQEDFWYGLEPFIALATIANVAVPSARALLHLAQLAAGPVAPSRGRDADAMGIAGLDKAGLLNFTSHGESA